MPTTANKKRLPEKIQAICASRSQVLSDLPTDDYLNYIKSQGNLRDTDTPVTIDILSESGRTSRFSCLEAITPRGSQAKLVNVRL